MQLLLLMEMLRVLLPLVRLLQLMEMLLVLLPLMQLLLVLRAGLRLAVLMTTTIPHFSVQTGVHQSAPLSVPAHLAAVKACCSAAPARPLWRRRMRQRLLWRRRPSLRR